MTMHPSDWARFKNQTTIQDSLNQATIAQKIVYRDWCVQLLIIVQRYGTACRNKDPRADLIYQELAEHINSKEPK